MKNTTNVYFVRHAQSDHTVHNEELRPLTVKGLADTKLVTVVLRDKDISVVFSSPYQRTMDTVKDLAEYLKLKVKSIDGLRERFVGEWVEDFKQYSKNQWDDFDYKLDGGESLREAQERNMNALLKIIRENEGSNIVIGTHGTALSTIINYYNKDYGYNDFWNIIDRMPYIVRFQYQGEEVISIEEIEIQD
ncbi:histidine phosphatase family protein [Paenibacillus sp. 7124]|uniref:Histidine phosphatase family protein n=1 Tax=Paenibacillus apii TaxID=1850370 RepID=A0A6M1PLV4_9BACL|nr:histidine phosphatase family protein [Paenibacillus apii]NGM83484.1 histidine phosphatase family protein [Paenibacillus apii]NJJ39118.1 histidine phosphatase family protein [Paenibacillus apii]